MRFFSILFLCNGKTLRRIVLILVVGVTALFVTEISRQAAGAPVVVDDAKAQIVGIRKLPGRHIVIYTDLASAPEIDSLPAVFDQAVPQWAEYFGVDEAKTRDWQVRAFLIGDRKAFDKLGVMPAGDDAFLHGLSVGADLWLYDQPSGYYRRHLLLHEGTHAFMGKFLGGCGPGWYMEGMAELFGTHRLEAKGEGGGRRAEGGRAEESFTKSQLVMQIVPRSREEVPMWGRIKLIREAVAAGRGLDLAAVMSLDNRKQMNDESYAWCWAATKFLDSQPKYREQFRKLAAHVTERDFNDVVKREFGADWPNIEAEWQAFVAALDYGYDFERMAIDFRRGTPLDGQPRSAKIAADRGWQSSGVWLVAGKSYHLMASGRYQIAVEKTSAGEKPWPCEPGGVTIDYHDGRPLGMLLGAIVEGGERKAEGGSKEQETTPSKDGFAQPIEIGLGATIKPAASGTLYLRVNDSAARLDDNRGSLTVTIED
jgi:hypothetical protein